MTQEDKELLLKDLCARLSYGVKIQESTLWYEGGKEIWKYRDIDLSINNINCISIDFIKPYLFPLSSMTEKLIHEFYCMFIENDISFEDFVADYWNTNSFHKLLTSIDDCVGVVEWFNENHCDYRGLIEKGLAIDATNLNIYYQ